MSRAGTARNGWTGAACLVMLSIAAAALKTRSYDFGWHLMAGETILERLTVPRADEFSFTSSGTPWADHEWLFQAIAALLFRVMGHGGLAALKALCALGAAAAGLTCMTRAGWSVGAALPVVSLAVLGLRARLGERPESVSLALAALLVMVLLSLSHGRERAAWRIAAVGGMACLWANLHAGALLAPALALAVAAGAALDAILASGREVRAAALGGAGRSLAAAAAALAALPLNPYGLEIFAIPSRIREALAPDNLLNPEWLPPTPASSPFFFAAAAAAAILVIAAAIRRRDGAGRSAGLVVAAIALGLTSARHTGLFFALLPAMAAGGSSPRSETTRSKGAGALAAAAVVILMLVVTPEGARTGVGLQPDRFPLAAADLLDARLPAVRAYNDAAFGGYLIWRGWPERRVFLDGRNEVHAALLRELSAALDDGRRWSGLMARHGVEAAVLSYRPNRIPVRDAVTGAASEGSFSETHFPSGSWALIHWDQVAMVFVRRDGRFGPLAAAMEYRHIRPEAGLIGLVQPVSGAEAAGVEADLARKLAEDPDCPVARRLATVYGLARIVPAGP